MKEENLQLLQKNETGPLDNIKYKNRLKMD